MSLRITVCVLLCLGLWSQVAGAETRRIAVVVGNNAGGEGQSALRYAESDAGKFARALIELGGVEREQLFLLQGKSSKQLQGVLSDVTSRVRAFQGDGSVRVVVIFYYSGHSDGLALELGADRMKFRTIRRWLSATGANVRLAIIDSCKSGRLVTAKGGKRGPAFELTLTDELSTAGEAILTSSAADELALESKEIGASFFSHHLVVGLRGAADSSGDGRVTLSEAYQYAYARTVVDSGATTVGAQHPNYDYRLSGQGELVLTDIARKSASLRLSAKFERALIIDLLRDQVVAELRASSAALLALPPGAYGIRIWRGGEQRSGRIQLKIGQEQVVRWAGLRVVSGRSAAVKGALIQRPGSSKPRVTEIVAIDKLVESSSNIALSVSAGLHGGVAEDVGGLRSIQVGVQSARLRGAGAMIEVATGQGPGFRESLGFLLGNYHWQVARGSLRAAVAIDAGAGAVLQTKDDDLHWTPALAVRPRLGISTQISGALALVLEVGLGLAVLQRDGHADLQPMPNAQLGIRWQ